MENTSTLSPESVTAVEILESISIVHRNQAVEMLRVFANELSEEQKWEKLYLKYPEPMKKMASEALEEHRSGKSKKF